MNKEITMFNVTTKSMEWGGASLSLETGKIARQASASILVKYNGTTVLVAVTTNKKSKVIGEKKAGIALTVNFIYKAYARCKIPAGFMKREGKPQDRDVLASRMIDRAIRPLFSYDFSDEVHVVCHLLAHDGSVVPEIPSLIGVSAALNISTIPFVSPVVAAHVGYNGESYQLNNTQGGMLDLIVAGTQDSILMVESEAKELNEGIMLDAITFGHENIQPAINFISEFSDSAGKREKISVAPVENQKIIDLIKDQCGKKIGAAYNNTSKEERYALLTALKEEVLSTVAEEEMIYAEQEIQKLEKEVVRNNIVENDRRIDGRKHNDIRGIDIVTDILPQTHGSALFTRGNTQALVVITLGDYNDEQIVDGIDGNSREHFMLHYNFPPYSVGEAAPLRPPSRREIGHGKLAWRALQAVLTNKSKFPYTIRIVSEITESDGSSSMATVCSSSLALMTAGVPIKSHVAGIAMGLIKEGNEYVILSDILGDEDHLGDMDFKVAGTEKGITALQMDIKVTYISKDIMQKALAQAREGRMHILGKMTSSIGEPCVQLKENAPCIATLQISPDDITKVIGTGGKVIKNICEVSKAKVDIEPHGKVLISASNNESMEQAKKMLNSILAVPKTGIVYDGQITGVAEFGVFARFLENTEGLVHISEIQDGHVDSIEEIIKVGDKVKIVVLSVDRDNRVRLSMKYVDQESGELFSEEYSKAIKSQARNGPNNRKRKPTKFNRNDSGNDSRNDSRSDRGSGDYQKNRRPKFF